MMITMMIMIMIAVITNTNNDINDHTTSNSNNSNSNNTNRNNCSNINDDSTSILATAMRPGGRDTDPLRQLEGRFPEKRGRSAPKGAFYSITLCSILFYCIMSSNVI